MLVRMLDQPAHYKTHFTKILNIVLNVFCFDVYFSCIYLQRSAESGLLFTFILNECIAITDL